MDIKSNAAGAASGAAAVGGAGGAGVNSNSITAQQRREVLGVFQRQRDSTTSQVAEYDAKGRNCLHYTTNAAGGGAGEHCAELMEIDSAVPTQRKNVILHWIQSQLGVQIEPFITSTTSSVYNHSVAGQNTVLPDTIAVTVAAAATAAASASGVSLKTRSKNNKSSQNNAVDAHLAADVNKENYPFYPVPENVDYTPGRSANMHGTYSIATYLGKLTSGAPHYTANAANQVIHNVQQQRQHRGAHHHSHHKNNYQSYQQQLQAEQKQLRRLGSGATATGTAAATQHSSCGMTRVGFLNDAWVNGLLLSEVVAALNVENKAVVKKVSCNVPSSFVKMQDAISLS